MSSKIDDLNQIAAGIVKNDVCPDLAQTAKQLVFGEGNPDSDIVFIGEAPGKNEDEQGIPFVGAAGKFLNEMLDSIALDRSDVYITNIVKYRPPNNRDPRPEEKLAFMGYLFRQLEVIEPKLIVTLGRHPMESFMVGKSISEVHGQPQQLDSSNASYKSERSVVLLPLYHPAAALYNGGLRKTLLEDFSKIPMILKSI